MRVMGLEKGMVMDREPLGRGIFGRVNPLLAGKTTRDKNLVLVCLFMYLQRLVRLEDKNVF